MQENSFGFAHLWASGDTVSHSVAVILAIMSIASWYLILAKAWDWWTVRRAARAVGIWFCCELKLPIAMLCSLRRDAGTHRVNLRAVGDKRFADREEGVQVVGKSVEVGQNHAVGAGESVVGEDGRQRDGQAGGCHDQRFTDRAGDFLQGSLARKTNGE